jgi:hypothetical protein
MRAAADRAETIALAGLQRQSSSELSEAVVINKSSEEVELYSSEELSSSEESEGSAVDTTRAAKNRARFEKMMQAQLQYELELPQELEGRDFEDHFEYYSSDEDSCENY